MHINSVDVAVVKEEDYYPRAIRNWISSIFSVLCRCVTTQNKRQDSVAKDTKWGYSRFDSWVFSFLIVSRVQQVIKCLSCLCSWSWVCLFACWTRTFITIRCCIGTVRGIIYTFATVYVILLRWCFLISFDKRLYYELDGDFINALDVLRVSIA